MATKVKARHQRQALTFMPRRERGWAMNMVDTDLWSNFANGFGGSRCVAVALQVWQSRFNPRSRYRNNVTGALQIEHPPIFRGGLLLDDMGLGNTLSMLSLIASDIASRAPVVAPIDRQASDSALSFSIPSTLVVVPPALIQSWGEQIKM